MIVATATLSPLDQAITAMMPMVIAPKGSEFSPISEGQRLVAASDGIYIEAAHSALYVRQRVLPGELPYGSLTDTVALPAGPIPAWIYSALVEDALKAHPKEMAALVTAGPDGYQLHRPIATATTGSVTYDDRGYGDCALVIDAHSHGHHPSYFSPMDDQSDLSRLPPHISIVFGRCRDTNSIEVCVRICAGQRLIPQPASLLRSLFA